MAKLGKKDLQGAINECIEHRLPFVFYRLPDDNEAHFICESKLGKEKLTEAPGFIICPFQKSEGAETRFIRKDRHYAGPVNDFSTIQLDIKDICGSESANTKVTKEEFCGYVEKAVKNIRKGKFDKVILSRVEKANVTESNPLQIFLSLCRKYTSAFVSLVIIPGKNSMADCNS